MTSPDPTDTLCQRFLNGSTVKRDTTRIVATCESTSIYLHSCSNHQSSRHCVRPLIKNIEWKLCQGWNSSHKSSLRLTQGDMKIKQNVQHPWIFI